MADPPFLWNQNEDKDRNKNTYKEKNEKFKNQNNKYGPAKHLYFNSFFKNEIGEKIIRLAREHNDYPAPIDNRPICLKFYMKGKCNREEACMYFTSHIFLLAGSFRKLMIYPRGILEWYDLEEKEKLKIKLEFFRGKKKSKKKLVDPKQNEEESKEQH